MVFTGTYRNVGDSRYVNSSGLVVYFHYTFNPETKNFENLDFYIKDHTFKLVHNVNPNEISDKFNFVLFLDNVEPIGILILDVENDELYINLTKEVRLTERESNDTNLYNNGEY